MVFTQPEELKAVTGTAAILLRQSIDHRNGQSNRVVAVMLRATTWNAPGSPEIHAERVKMRLHGARQGTVAHRQEAQAVPDWETGGAGFTQRAVGGRPPPAPAHSALMSLTHPGTRSRD